MMFGPIATIADYPGGKHPKIADLRRRAQLAIKGLRRVVEHGKNTDERDVDWVAGADAENVDENWRVSLQHMREMQIELETGLATRRFVRELRKLAPDLVATFDAARIAAIEALKQHRAFAAVMADENDDEELGIEVVPKADDAPVRGPSVSFDW